MNTFESKFHAPKGKKLLFIEQVFLLVIFLYVISDPNQYIYKASYCLKE